MRSTILTIVTICCAVTHLAAQQLYTDTFKLAEQPTTVVEDRWLLDMLSEQSEQIFIRDSLWRDSLLYDMEQQQVALQERLAEIEDSLIRLNDSIYRLRREQLARVEKAAEEEEVDSIQLMIDSISYSLMATKEHPYVPLSPRQVDNRADDLEQLKAQLRSLRTHWYREGNIMVQFSQNYSSPNWYSGGSPLGFSLLASFKGRLAYIKDKIAWESLIDWRNGISTTPSDSLRAYNITDDLIRIHSKFGYQIYKKLYASASVDFQTTQWNTWKSNTRELKSAFLTPIYFNLNIGLDYKPLPDLSIAIAPANYRMVYALHAHRRGVDVTAYGIAAGKELMQEFGSSVRVNWKYKIIREIALETEFYVYTNYRGIELDLEVNCDFIINRFLTAHVMLRPRYDSTKRKSGEPLPRVQFKDLVSIGFSHKFY